MSLGAMALMSVVSAAEVADQFTSLPGFNGTMQTESYSGYLNVNANKSLHYLFYKSRNDPVNDPIILWFNGGPGCSSLLGAFQELGPYLVDDELSPNFQVNDHSWNNNASLLFLESPAGVGYSIAKNPSDYPTNDFRQSEDAIKALLDWFSKFPEFKPNAFYISGESYGGIYVPWMTW